MPLSPPLTDVHQLDHLPCPQMSKSVDAQAQHVLSFKYLKTAQRICLVFRTEGCWQSLHQSQVSLPSPLPLMLHPPVDHPTACMLIYIPVPVANSK